MTPARPQLKLGFLLRVRPLLELELDHTLRVRHLHELDFFPRGGPSRPLQQIARCFVPRGLEQEQARGCEISRA